jgi:predicted nucleotidyltransferase
MSNQRVENFLRTFTNWANEQPDMLAVALVGSVACGTAGPDSDVDLVLITDAPRLYLQDTGWTNRFGVVQKQLVEDYGLVQSLRVWYRGGPEVEYGLTDQRWLALPLDPATRRVIMDGLRVLMERGPLLSRHLDAG